MRTRGDVGVVLAVLTMVMAVFAVAGALSEAVSAQGRAPGAFGKSGPTHNATGQSTTLLLEWTASAGANSYEYCLDTTLNDTCDAAWNVIPPAVGIVVESLAAGATYEWQVRANDGGGTTEADGGTWFRFTTRILPSGTYFLDDLETAGALGWGRQGTWDVTTETAHSPSHAWSDSPAGPYAADVNSAIQSPAISLSGALLPRLTFWHRYEFADGDRGIVLVTTNDGTTYTELQSYTGSDPTWRQATIDLSEYAGESSLRVVFQLSSNGSQEADGWYIDDIAVAEPGPTFTDDPLLSGVTPVRGVHVSELRLRIDALRMRFGLGSFPWTDAIVSGVTAIRAQHVLDLRTALAEVYQRANRTAPTYTDAGLAPGITPMRAVHIQELRDAIVAIE